MQGVESTCKPRTALAQCVETPRRLLSKVGNPSKPLQLARAVTLGRVLISSSSRRVRV